MILLTGYEPFADFETNPSGQVARELDGERVGGHEVVGEVLPVEFDATASQAIELVEEYDPAAVVSTGLAGGRAAVAVERVGVNVADAVGTPDNADADPVDQRISHEGPDAHFATLPVADIVAACHERDIPARLSNTAGTHLCNNLLYAVRDYAEREGLDLPSGFVHLPLTPAQAVRQSEEATRGGAVDPSMPLSMQVEALRTAIEVTVGAESN